MEPEEEPGGAAVREVYEEVRRVVAAYLLSLHTHRILRFYGVFPVALWLRALRRRQGRSHECSFCCLTEDF